jgi:trehalose 6-phosphate phosphatase
MERKPGAIAIHWRNLSSSAVLDIREGVLRVWNGLRPQNLVLFSAFDGGLEFRVRTRNKGDAVRQILAELDDATPVAYLGDDYTDEDAFKAIENRGLSVLVRKEYRPTAATTWIQPPQGLLSFLAEWLQACGGSET